MQHWFTRVRGLPVVVQDAAIAVAVAAFEVMSLAVAVNEHNNPATPTVAFLVLGVSQLPLALRRRHPVLTWTLVGIGTGVYGIAPWVDPPVFAGALLAIASVGYLVRTRTSLALLAVSLIGVVAVWPFDPQPHDLNDLLVPILGLSTAWLIGFAGAAHRRNVTLLEEQSAQAEQAHADEAQRVIVQERLRIARDLHDMTAHHVAVIAVHAEAGQTLVNDPVASGRAFGTIAGSARDALHDLRRTVGALRGDGDVARDPAPGIDDVALLVGQLRDAGLDATFEQHGDLSSMADDIALAAFRIVQEALTNTMKHAHATRVDVTLSRSPDGIDVVVIDDGTSSPEEDRVAGHGLVGMRERARACRGTLDAGQRGDAPGFRVHARLPS